MTRFPGPFVATATKRERSGDQHIEVHKRSAADERIVQVIPSGLVMTRFPTPPCATATKSERSGDQHTEFQLLAVGVALCVQLIPLGLVMTQLVVVPLNATDTNKDSCGDQHTEYHDKSAGVVRNTQELTITTENSLATLSTTAGLLRICATPLVAFQSAFT
jgi:hypothetical protein